MVSLTEMGWKLNVNLAFWWKLRMFPFSLSSSQLKVCWVSPEETNLHLARLPVKQDFCCTPCEFYIPNGFPTSSQMYFSKFVFIFVVKVCLWDIWRRSCIRWPDWVWVRSGLLPVLANGLVLATTWPEVTSQSEQPEHTWVLSNQFLNPFWPEVKSQ